MWEMLVPDFWGVAHHWEAGWLSRTEMRLFFNSSSLKEGTKRNRPAFPKATSQKRRLIGKLDLPFISSVTQHCTQGPRALHRVILMTVLS